MTDHPNGHLRSQGTFNQAQRRADGTATGQLFWITMLGNLAA